jgi:hypothetical protein
LYQNILGRDPKFDVSRWTNHTGIASTISKFFTSDEFQLKRLPHEDIVDRLYRSILGRECRSDEKSRQIDQLRGGVAIVDIVNDLVGSEEYRQRVQLGAVPPPDPVN